MTVALRSAAALLVSALLVPALPPPASAAAGERTALAVICNRYCDARDPALAPAVREAVATTLLGRRISLHANDTDAMLWAQISTGQTGDEVWLDRSFDGGRSWASGSWLGATRIPAGVTGWRTMMYNNDDWAGRGVGALRACARPVNQQSIACTTWARTTWNAWDRRTAATTALMQFYDNGTGLFSTTGWWNAANALTAVIDNSRISGLAGYQYAIANTYDRNLGAYAGSFRNEYLDDTGWWALAWIAAYDLTRDARYLNTARVGADYMHGYWDGVCGGGIWWRTSRTVKNAIANELYIQVNAALHNRIAGDTAYLQRARAGWNWFQASGMINSGNLINDGLVTATCRNNGDASWSYNQGVILAALAELYRGTGDAALLTAGRRLAGASTTTSYLNPGGILRDPGESPGGGGADGPSFKGAYVRGLAAFNAQLADRPYSAYLRRQADSAYARNRTALHMYGLLWAGPWDRSDAARQQTATDLMNAAP